MTKLAIRVWANPAPDEDRLRRLFAFLHGAGLGDGGTLTWKESSGACRLPSDSPYVAADPEQAIDLDVGFPSEVDDHTTQLLGALRPPMFLAGRAGIPTVLDHVCVPFERTRFGGSWLHRVMETADHQGWKVRLVHCDHGLVTKEIVRLADWFRLDVVKEALRNWLTDEVRQQLRHLIETWPETEVKTDVGKLDKAFLDEDPGRTMILGGLSSGYHLPHRHHGLDYGRLLAKTGLSGYFIGG